MKESRLHGKKLDLLVTIDNGIENYGKLIEDISIDEWKNNCATLLFPFRFHINRNDTQN